LPSASMTCHWRSISSALAEKVFISQINKPPLQLKRKQFVRLK